MTFRECANYVFMFRQHTKASFERLYDAFGQDGFDRWRDFRKFLLDQTKVQYTCVIYYRDLNFPEKFKQFKIPDMTNSKFAITMPPKHKKKKRMHS